MFELKLSGVQTILNYAFKLCSVQDIICATYFNLVKFLVIELVA